MEVKIAQLRRYPLKGARGIAERQLRVNASVGVVGDREFAIRKVPGDVTNRAEKFDKLEYFVCANTPSMATEIPQFKRFMQWYELAPDYLEGLAGRIRAGVSGDKLMIQKTYGNYHLGDTAGAQVSFINLVTLCALEQSMGERIVVQPERFRMNVWITGLPAFAEYEWVGDKWPGSNIMQVGKVRMRIDDAAERCAATHANPETGMRDMRILDALDALMSARGYKSPHREETRVMGFYGVVLDEGVINVGDEIRLL